MKTFNEYWYFHITNKNRIIGAKNTCICDGLSSSPCSFFFCSENARVASIKACVKINI
jgi:hypothetical protein